MNVLKNLLAVLSLLFASFMPGYCQETLKVIPCTSQRSVHLSSSKTLAAPANDNYSNATILSIGSPAISGTTTGATLETNEVTGCNAAANQTVWYLVTATAAVTYLRVYTSDSCSVGTVIWPATGLPIDICTMLDCQGSGNGPDTTVFKITGAVGAVYAVQVTYTSGSPCSASASFTIRAVNSFSGIISNPGPVNSCSTPTPGCYFTYTPTISNVISTCPGDSLVSQVNLINHQFYTFTTPATDSYILEFNDILQATCTVGNVLWSFWRLYDSSCNVLTCGNQLSTSVTVSCDSTYILEYMWEEIPCTYYIQWPYMYAPTGTLGCNPSTAAYEIQNQEVMIFPNPVSDFMNVSSGSFSRTKNLYACLFDSRGAFVFSIDDINVIDVRELNTGMYVIKIISPGGEVFIKRFVKN
jgi:hypothetical protein